MQEFTKNSIFVKDSEAGMRLDRLLALRFPVINRDEWQKRILDGMVLVQSRKTKPSRKLQTEDEIEFYYRKKEEPEVSFDVKILYEDDDLLILDKPANLPVHPSGIYYRNTLHGYLKDQYGENFIPRFAHRLDRETSGILILTKNTRAASIIQKSFSEGEIHKEYSVIAVGNFPDYMDAEGFLGRDENSAIRKKRKFMPANYSEKTEEMETSRTEFFLEYSVKNLSLLRVILHTGRMHQIRATLCSLGFPVVGDRLYGVDENLYLKLISGQKSDEDLKLLRMERTALHCGLMEFKHPKTDTTMRIESPLPDDMKIFLESLR